MYNIPYHREQDQQAVLDLIAEYPFAFLTGSTLAGEQVATQVPVFIEEKEGRQVLRGHIMKGTDHHRAFVENPNVLVVVSGRSTYVSGTWYSDPHSPSTWNYMSVHIQGKVKFMEGDGLVEILRKTTLHFEDNDPASSTIYDNLPAEFIRQIMPMIVGFEITIGKMRNVFKLSQDRDYESYLNIISRLREQGDDAQEIAFQMEKRIGELFPDKADS